MSDIVFWFVYITTFFTAVFFLMLVLEARGSKAPVLRNFPTVTIVIPAYNEASTIKASVERALAIDYPKDKLDVVIVDDGSKDATYAIAKKLAGKRVHVFTKPNGGKASAVNHALKHTRGDYIMVLDADTFPDADVLKKTMGHFDDENVAAVNLPMRVHNPQSLLERMQTVEYTIMNMMRYVLSTINALNVASTGTIIRKSFLVKSGGFSEGNLTEDFELGLRIQHSQLQIRHTLETYVETVVPSTLAELKRQRVRWGYGGIVNLLNYRSMLNRKYGDLGLFVMPMMLIALTVFPLIFVYYIGLLIWNAYYNLYLLNLLSFDVNYLITSFFEFFSYGQFRLNFYLFAVALLFGFVVYVMAARKTGQPIRLSYVPYVFIYGLLISYYNLVALYRYAAGNKPRW